MILKDFINYMTSLGNTPEQIKIVLNKFLSRRKCPKIKVCLNVLNISYQTNLYFFKSIGN
jgi:hypothetical protein